jgi:thiol-disulfide isomerase/thioredoxin
VRYNEADFEKAKSEGKGVYVYIYATWCPLCAEERPKILGAFGDLNIQNAVGFESHWKDFQDTAEDSNLAREYSVASQHTHLFIGSDGSLIYKKVGALEEGELQSRLEEISQD